MFLVEIFLPLADNDGQPLPRSLHDSVMAELTERFGGVTAYPRSPATGLWKDSSHGAKEDRLVVYEVMCERLDQAYWTALRTRLEADFRQDKVLMRAQGIEVL